MNFKDAFFREYVDPFFKERGFTRKGRTYRVTAENGDVVFAHFWSPPGSLSDDYKFHVVIGVSPEPWQDLVRQHQLARGRRPAAEVGMGSALFRYRIPPPDGDRWHVTESAGPAAAWEALLGPLSTAVRDAVSFLDRESLLAYKEGGGIHVDAVLDQVRLVLRVDSASDAELEELLATVDRKYHDTEFINWARSRRTRGEPAGDG
jgi:hypothetical protein